MARGDYRGCDVCDGKAFYDANLSYENGPKEYRPEDVPYRVAGAQQYPDDAMTVCGWGNGGAHIGRGVDVRRMLHNPHCLRLTKDGHPSHPLYLPASLQPVEWVVTPNVRGKA
jgi:Protein of unknown function (DUF1643)